ncbi:hypothetical protein [Dictyobacter formicarum]|uniref:Uncharacterized protein n=1 Tax=Dictyobacter formicarum TaxID=2778368 RepID=A0ABQ3VPP8_9CHLR|nr:hypothetical protein [Dictyobacter formicarum]GHO88232.1 hypothetical protein KSZ_62380 [Dictyobacter formicarum]
MSQAQREREEVHAMKSEEQATESREQKKVEGCEQIAIKAALMIEEELLVIERTVANIRAALDQLMC